MVKEERDGFSQNFAVRGILDKGEYPNLWENFDHKPEYFVVE